jgi:hypothetical protein
MTPEGTVSQYPLAAPWESLSGIGVGPDGNMWFTEFDTTIGTPHPNNNAIARIGTDPPPSTVYRDGVKSTAGLRGYWRLGESSGTSAVDAAGNHNGAYTSGTSLGKPGALKDGGDRDTAAGFDGGAGSVLLPALGTATGPVTIEGWSNLDQSAPQNNQLYGSYNSERLIIRPSGVFADIVIGGTHYACQGPSPTNVGRWVYWAFTRNGNTLAVYRNGKPHNISCANTPANGTVTLAGNIGGGPNGYPFDGSIDEVAVSDQALTASAVQRRFLDAQGG